MDSAVWRMQSQCMLGYADLKEVMAVSITMKGSNQAFEFDPVNVLLAVWFWTSCKNK